MAKPQDTWALSGVAQGCARAGIKFQMSLMQIVFRELQMVTIGHDEEF
jgi:hypothetical protein